jgi:hypothetical protein
MGSDLAVNLELVNLDGDAFCWRRNASYVINCRSNTTPKQLGKDSMQWTPEAEAKLKEIPFFVRPAARKKIEKLAVEMGATEITATIYDEAKKKFGNN